MAGNFVGALAPEAIYVGEVPVLRVHRGAELLWPSGYAANAVHFDGSNDYLARGSGLIGAADSKLLTFSAWLRLQSLDWQLILVASTSAGGGNIRARQQYSDDLADPGFVFSHRNAVNGEIGLSVRSSELPTDAWVHILGSFDLSDTNKRHLYVNDVSDLATVSSYLDANLDFTYPNWAVGGFVNGTQKFTGDLADIWFAPGVYIDFSIEANRRKFISAVGKPVFLGDNGEMPTGSAPLVFLSGPTDSWHINKGTGGGFTENGALTDAATSPSD